MFAALSARCSSWPSSSRSAQHHGPLDAGVRLLPWTATLFVVAPLAGARIARVGERPFAVAGLATASGRNGLDRADRATRGGLWRLVAPLVMAGAGVSMAMPALQNAVMGAVAPARLGQASGTFNTVRQLGGVFGIAVLVAVFTGSGGYASPELFSDGFAAAIGASAALSLLGAVAGLGLPRAAAQVANVPARVRPEMAGSIE